MNTRVLVAPLDWGLGHATRCIPIITRLLQHGCDVVIAGSGESLELLKAAFPALKAISIPGYHPVYPTRGSMAMVMAKQLPKFIRTIRQEHARVEEIVRSEKIDLVISDNRFGAWTKIVPAVFITHQSNVLMPKRFGWLAAMTRKATGYFMNKFTTCWIPDFPEPSAMAGRLVSFGKINVTVPVEFIGSLSRFTSTGRKEKKYDVVAVFSGPEPQRSILEKIVSQQLFLSSLRYLLVRGLPDKKTSKIDIALSPTGHCVNFLNGDSLQEVMEQAEVIIARSGYSTLMDLAALRCRAILVPTPGQTEQEYLADELMRRRIAYSVAQQAFDLKTALSAYNEYSGFVNFPTPNTLLDAAIKKILHEKIS